MSDNKQPFDKHDENAGSIKAQPSVHPAGSRRRVAYAALAGAALGAVVSGVAAAFTGKGVADGVKAVVEAAVDTVKRASEGVKSTIIEGAVDTVKGVGEGVPPTPEGTPDTVKAAAAGVKSTVEDTLDTVKAAAAGVKFTVEDTLDTVKAAAAGVKSTVEDTLDTVKAAAAGIKSTVEGDVTIVPGGHDASQVSAPVEKERVVVERPPRVDAVRPVASGEVDFHKGKVARMEVEQETAKIHTIPQSLDAPAATGTADGAAFNATHSVANDATPNAANDATSSAALVQLLLRQVGTEVAMSFYEQLPAVVFAEIQRLATNPTLQEKQRIRDSWAKTLEPLALAIIRSGQSFDFSAAPAASNGHHKQVNQLEGSSNGNR